MRKMTSPSREISSQSGEEFYLEHDLTSPDGAYSAARVFVVRSCMLLQGELKTSEASLHWLSKKYGLGSLPKKLKYSEPCKLQAWQFFRLQKAYRNAVKSNNLRMEHYARVAEATGMA
jgi:hypothetical protein